MMCFLLERSVTSSKGCIAYRTLPCLCHVRLAASAFCSSSCCGKRSMLPEPPLQMFCFSASRYLTTGGVACIICGVMWEGFQVAAAVACKAGISAMLALCPLYTEELFPVNLQVAVLQACKLVSPTVTLLLTCQTELCNLQDLLLVSAMLDHSSAIQNCLKVLVQTGSVTSCVLQSCTYC